MINTLCANHGMATSPHHLASQSALKVLRDGGNAIEAMVSAAATIAVVYPHMNSIGGDGFWLVLKPNGEQITIDASGASAKLATIDTYLNKGLNKIPFRGAMAANTVAGTVSGWQKALEISDAIGGNKTLDYLLSDAICYAEEGFPVTEGQSLLTNNKLAELKDVPGFAKTFLEEGKVPKPTSVMTNRRLANTLKTLAADGLDSFYRGKLAQQIAQDLMSVGSPITLEDLQQHFAQIKNPLHLQHSLGNLYNVQPPSQGLVSLIILGLLDRTNLKNVQADSADHVHLVVEATKLAFQIRDQAITDPSYMTKEAQQYLDPSNLDDLAKSIKIDKAMSWGEGKGPGDTIWMGTIDKDGLAVSFIQSIYHEYGSGVVLESSGINWQNRGASFSLDKNHINALLPMKKPFHTLNPAGARFKDGRVMVYGNMGGDGQPQSQAAVFTRYAVFNQPLQTAVTAPRWLLGRTWGQSSDTLKLESRFPQELFEELTKRGHDVEKMGIFDSALGHAGAIVRMPNGVLLGATDPRADGVVAAF
ncbi:gamma-glutamyltransferase family protein [Polynucleobacter rarus]|uniref:gamma-glutamyltransferase family protein n=1 Tax=Polynucleobacter rarus TaxID=556055 RepID=UPI000D3E7730